MLGLIGKWEVLVKGWINCEIWCCGLEACVCGLSPSRLSVVVDGLGFTVMLLFVWLCWFAFAHAVSILFYVSLMCLMLREGKWRLEQVFRFWCEWYEGAFPRLKVVVPLYEPLRCSSLILNPYLLY